MKRGGAGEPAGGLAPDRLLEQEDDQQDDDDQKE
jgi:hypothetical protein